MEHSPEMTMPLIERSYFILSSIAPIPSNHFNTTFMKKITLLITSLFLLYGTFATTNSVAPSPVKASELMVPLGNSGNKISLLALSTIKAQDFERLSGKKMNWIGRIEFKLAQRQLRRNINADGTVNSKRLKKVLADDGSTGFHIGGFALGLFLGLIGVLIAYLINDDKKSKRVKWAWIGAAFAVVLYILLLI